MHKDVEEILFSSDQIAERVKDLGAEITRDYAWRLGSDESLVVVCLLRGAAVFMADLIRNIDLPLEIDFMVVSSYGNAASSSGAVQIQKDLSSDISGRHVIVVEDIIDTGLTLGRLLQDLRAREPKTLAVAAMLKRVRKSDDDERADSPADVPTDVHLNGDYVGFECEDGFIVGYGLDYAQRYRNLPYIGILKPEIYS